MSRKKRKEKKQERKDKRKDKRKKRPKLGFRILLPFKKAMKKILDKRGIQYDPRSIEDIAIKFYKHIVKMEHYSPQTTVNYTDLKTIDPVTITVIISAIATWLKELKKKKQKGGQLTEIEEDALQGGENAGDIINDMKNDYKEEKLGEIISEYWWVLLLLAFLFFRSK